MSDVSAALPEPELYKRFQSSSSKDARENLPLLVDQVVDTGRPVVITKLKLGRAALIPARDLWIYEIIELLKMDRESVNKPIDQLIEEVYQRTKLYLEMRSGDALDVEGTSG